MAWVSVPGTLCWDQAIRAAKRPPNSPGHGGIGGRLFLWTTWKSRADALRRLTSLSGERRCEDATPIALATWVGGGMPSRYLTQSG